jgi:hypothetical protein
MQTELISIRYSSQCDRDFLKRYLSEDLEATANMRTLLAAEHGLAPSLLLAPR